MPRRRHDSVFLQAPERDYENAHDHLGFLAENDLLSVIRIQSIDGSACKSNSRTAFQIAQIEGEHQAIEHRKNDIRQLRDHRHVRLPERQVESGKQEDMQMRGEAEYSLPRIVVDAGSVEPVFHIAEIDIRVIAAEGKLKRAG